MLLKTLFSLFSLPPAIALVPPQVLTFGTVLLDLSTVDQATLALLSKVNGFNKTQTIFGAIPILTFRDNLEAAITKATTDATFNPIGYKFTPTDAQTFGDLVSGGLTPHVNSLLQAMKTKKPDFDAVGATRIVINSIATLSKMTDKLGVAWIALTPDEGDLIARGKAIQEVIDGYYQDCYNFYSPIMG